MKESEKNIPVEPGRKDFPLQDYYSKIYPKYDLVNRIFTFGQDVKWRKKAVRECLQDRPGRILDVCTGTGDLVIDIAGQTRPGTELHGYDFSAEMLGIARQKAEKKNADISFEEGNVAAMPYEDGFFDAAGISFGIRNLVYENSNAGKHLEEIRRVIRPGGRFVVLESSKPVNRLWRVFNNLYLQWILPWLGGLISGNFKAYRYLASSSKNYYSVDEMALILENAGFVTKRKKSLFIGSVMLIVAEKQ